MISPVHKPHQTVHFSGCIGSSCIACDCPNWPILYSFNRKWVSSSRLWCHSLSYSPLGLVYKTLILVLPLGSVSRCTGAPSLLSRRGRCLWFNERYEERWSFSCHIFLYDWHPMRFSFILFIRFTTDLEKPTIVDMTLEMCRVEYNYIIALLHFLRDVSGSLPRK